MEVLEEVDEKEGQGDAVSKEEKNGGTLTHPLFQLLAVRMDKGLQHSWAFRDTWVLTVN